VDRLTRRIYIYDLDGQIGIPENLAVCGLQYARNKAIARSIQKTTILPLCPALRPLPHSFKNQIRLIKFSVAT